MSDDVSPEDRAGQYVLGVLDAADMQAVRRDAAQDGALAAAIEMWERRLAPLTALVGETPPPSELWQAIAARLDGDLPAVGTPQPRRAPSDGRRAAGNRALAAWRAAAIGSMAIAAGLAGLLVWRVQTTPAAPRLAMILPLQQTPGAWLVELRPDGSIRIMAEGNVTRPTDRDFELWALAEHATRPVPLGLMPVAANVAELHVADLPHTSFKLLVSLEPKGGSPTALPTGPVLFGADIAGPPT
jgi:anti-sigma-K factor RskA